MARLSVLTSSGPLPTEGEWRNSHSSFSPLRRRDQHNAAHRGRDLREGVGARGVTDAVDLRVHDVEGPALRGHLSADGVAESIASVAADADQRERTLREKVVDDMT